MKNLLIFFPLLVFVLFLQVPITFAQSDYVLPYPSNMPGSIWYQLDLIFEEIQKYWYFGGLSQYKYNLKQADKYLVEAKILFEYKQYLLAHRALIKSDKYFIYTFDNMLKAEGEKKDVSDLKKIFENASIKHRLVLEELIKNTPETFVWRPEDGSVTDIPILKSLNRSIRIRANL